MTNQCTPGENRLLEDQRRELKVGISDSYLWFIPANHILPYILQPFKAPRKVMNIIVWIDPKSSYS